MYFSEERSASLRYFSSNLRSTRIAVGAEKSTVTPYFSTVCHQMAGVGESRVKSGDACQEIAE